MHCQNFSDLLSEKLQLYIVQIKLFFMCICDRYCLCVCVCTGHMWQSKDNSGCQSLLSTLRQGLFVRHCNSEADHELLRTLLLLPRITWYIVMVTCSTLWMQVLSPLCHLLSLHYFSFTRRWACFSSSMFNLFPGVISLVSFLMHRNIVFEFGCWSYWL